MSAESPQLLVIIGDSMVTEDGAVVTVFTLFTVFMLGPGGGHAMWGWLGWLLIKYQYRCLLPCTLAPGVSAALQRSWHSNIKKYNNRAPCAEAGWQQERSVPLPSAALLLHPPREQTVSTQFKAGQILHLYELMHTLLNWKQSIICR